MKSQFHSVILFSICLIGCSSSIEPPNGTVSFYFQNSTGTNMTLSVYDNVCNRSFFRVPVARASETPLTTCAGNDGRADIRYRRRTTQMSDDNPWRDSRVGSNQIIVVR